MLKAYKYRIFPTDEQQNKLAGVFGQVRFVYNLGLETKVAAYASSQTNITCFELNKQITELQERYRLARCAKSSTANGNEKLGCRLSCVLSRSWISQV